MGLIVVPFTLGWDLKYIVLVMSIGPFLRSIFLIWLLLRSITVWPDFSSLRKEWSKSLPYAGGLLLVAIAGVASVEVDKWVVSAHYQSDFIYAIYAVGARKIPFLSAITASITSSLVVHFTDDFENKRYHAIVPAMRRATDKLFLIVTPLLIFGFFYAPQIMVILFHKYASSAPIFRIYLITVMTQFFFAESVIRGTGNSRINAVAGFTELIVNIILSIYLVNKIGLIGPPIATLIAHVFFQLVMMGYCTTRLHMRISDFMPTTKIWPLAVTIPAFIIAALSIEKLVPNQWISMVIAGALAGILMLVQMGISRNSKVMET